MKQGRPSKAPTVVIRVPVDKIPAVERALGRPVAENQTPHVNVRVPAADVAKIRKVIGKFHVYPVNDLKDHECANCWCNPKIDDENLNLLVHNSMDGREACETGERKLQ